MTTVTNLLIDETGTPQPNVAVSIRLVGGTGSAPDESFTSGDSQIVSLISTETNSSGKWVLDLIPNDTILPAGSHYEVVHTVPGGAPDAAIAFVVPVDGATPSVHTLHSLMTL